MIDEWKDLKILCLQADSDTRAGNKGYIELLDSDCEEDDEVMGF